MESKERFETVVFDLDGTLIDSLQDLADSTNIALTSAGLPPHPLSSYRHFVGEGVRMLAERALPEDSRDPASTETLVEAILAEYSRRWAATSRPYPGIPELLDGMVARNLPLAILSNKPQDFTRKIAEHLLGSWPFAAVYGARPKEPRKPDPTAALGIADELGVSPGKCLYLGDTAIDMRTASSAGMFGVGVLWGFRGAEELREGGARKLVARPTEILDLL